MESLSNQNQELKSSLAALSESIELSVEFAMRADESSTKVANEQLKLATLLGRVNSSVHMLKVDNEKVKEYLSISIPVDVSRMYNEARKGN